MSGPNVRYRSARKRKEKRKRKHLEGLGSRPLTEREKKEILKR